jgi:hypothetical protein
MTLRFPLQALRLAHFSPNKAKAGIPVVLGGDAIMRERLRSEGDG